MFSVLDHAVCRSNLRFLAGELTRPYRLFNIYTVVCCFIMETYSKRLHCYIKYVCINTHEINPYKLPQNTDRILIIKPQLDVRVSHPFEIPFIKEKNLRSKNNHVYNYRCQIIFSYNHV